MTKLTMLGALWLFCISAAIAQQQVTGKVTDSKDATPLPAVSVKVKGSNVGVTTGTDGSFSITIPKGLSTLQFSSTGYDD